VYLACSPKTACTSAPPCVCTRPNVGYLFIFKSCCSQSLHELAWIKTYSGSPEYPFVVQRSMRLRLTRFSISLLGSKEKLPTYSIASFLIQMHLTASAIEETLTFCNLIGTRSNQSVDRCWNNASGGSERLDLWLGSYSVWGSDFNPLGSLCLVPA